ncbi:hypothetical protein RRG08_065640 [Elysia crispata]|uniref:Uncharacterized protein n=1 Tax=Elysia crispata TaxID=231223 RepID=A0AAE0YNB4_9GAST|nr:hypothetical protein RRG08_065640 [Elysia crispata]
MLHAKAPVPRAVLMFYRAPCGSELEVELEPILRLYQRNHFLHPPAVLTLTSNHVMSRGLDLVQHRQEALCSPVSDLTSAKCSVPVLIVSLDLPLPGSGELCSVFTRV